MEEKILVLGAGISGLGAAYSAKKQGIGEVLVLEKDSDYGGMCGNFEISGFRFDRFVHLSFTKSDEVKRIFNLSVENTIEHEPNPYNYYKTKWLKHPAQNNIYPLCENEKAMIIEGFKSRADIENNEVRNYEDWLRLQYGDYFAENFPMVYTRKYWMCEANELETKWIGERLYRPTLEEVLRGSSEFDTPNTYYAKKMYYPSKGGYKAYLTELVRDVHILFNAKASLIDIKNKKLVTEDGRIYLYNKLVSSLPLPELIKIISDAPKEVKDAAARLRCTSGYQVSIGLKGSDIPPYLWWYVYDSDIIAARIFSPSQKSPDNAPIGCSSLQFEIYCEKAQYSNEDLYLMSVGKLIQKGVINEANILFVDIRFEKYANVVFDHGIYENRKIIIDYLNSIGIKTIGRFGEWEYFWSDQSLLSGLGAFDS
jgi:protoporphyrinogen oxidase